MEKEDIEINKSTCAIIPIDSSHCKVVCEKDYNLSFSTMEVIDYTCKYFGSSFNGRVEGSRFLLGSFYKLPIIIEEQTETIFFPTHSYKNKECAWLSLNLIKEYKKSGYNVEVIFNNGKKIFLPISFDSFEAQLFCSTKLLLMLQKRNKGI